LKESGEEGGDRMSTKKAKDSKRIQEDEGVRKNTERPKAQEKTDRI